MTNLCSVTADLGRHMDFQDRADEFQEAIDTLTNRLLQDDDFDPFTECNFNLGLEEVDLWPVICLFRTGLIKEGGELQIKLVTEYWASKARNKAEFLVENASCRKCFDVGCQACFD